MIESLVFVHGLVAKALVLYALVLGVWGTYQYFRGGALSGGFRSSYLLLAGLTLVQGLLGGIAFTAGPRPHSWLHLVYGIFAVIFLPGVYIYAQPNPTPAPAGAPDKVAESRQRRREAALLAGAAWIVSVAFFRGIATSS